MKPALLMILFFGFGISFVFGQTNGVVVGPTIYPAGFHVLETNRFILKRMRIQNNRTNDAMVLICDNRVADVVFAETNKLEIVAVGENAPEPTNGSGSAVSQRQCQCREITVPAEGAIWFRPGRLPFHRGMVMSNATPVRLTYEKQ